MFSNKFVTSYKYTLIPEEQIGYLKSTGTDYVVFENLDFSSTRRYLLPAIKKYPEKFKKIKAIPEVWKDNKKMGREYLFILTDINMMGNGKMT